MVELTSGTSSSQPTTSDNQTGMDRRQALWQVASAIGGAVGALTLPRSTFGQEPATTGDIYKLRDVERVYEIWRNQSKSTHLPPLEVLRDAVMTCREAACSIFLMRGPILSAIHSGFVVSIPEEHQTPSTRGKIYVVTCDHARLDHGGTKPIIQLPNGTNITPQSEIVAKGGQKGIPVKDLRIYECAASAFAGVKALDIRPIAVHPPQNAPVMTYEPLNLKARQIIDERRQTVVLERQPQSKPVVEKFILTHVSHPSDFPFDPSYPESSGFNTAGQLKVGGSGSPVILFTEDEFFVAGHQVSYGDRHDLESEERIDGEIDNDGNVVHINNAIKLLHERGRWK